MDSLEVGKGGEGAGGTVLSSLVMNSVVPGEECERGPGPQYCADLSGDGQLGNGGQLFCMFRGKET